MPATAVLPKAKGFSTPPGLAYFCVLWSVQGPVAAGAYCNWYFTYPPAAPGANEPFTLIVGVATPVHTSILG